MARESGVGAEGLRNRSSRARRGDLRLHGITGEVPAALVPRVGGPVDGQVSAGRSQ